MTDLELLELAAKAAGLKYSDLQFKGETGLCILVDHQTSSKWNPLEDDGDALRLACDLALKVFPVARTPSGRACSAVARVTGERLAEESDASISVREATRRAIVRAAAEIGKTVDKY